MRILICAPWFQNLSRRHAASLIRAGHDVMILSTHAQGERSGEAVSEELIIDPRLKSAAGARDFIRAIVRVRKWRPELVITDESWDPRFWLITRMTKCGWTIVHDATPHDHSHLRRGWKRLVEADYRKRSSAIIAFSDFVASQLSAHGKPILRWPLTSEVVDSIVPMDASSRNHFSFVGRVSEYKGIDFLLQAWESFVRREPAAELHILGQGHLGNQELPRGCTWENRRYTDEEAVNLMKRSRAVILPYQEASQSGVQVLAMQCGAPTIVTCKGALPEFQPDHRSIVKYGDVEALVHEMNAYCSNTTVESASGAARSVYESMHSEEALDRAIFSSFEAFRMNNQ